MEAPKFKKIPMYEVSKIESPVEPEEDEEQKIKESIAKTLELKAEREKKPTQNDYEEFKEAITKKIKEEYGKKIKIVSRGFNILRWALSFFGILFIILISGIIILLIKYPQLFWE